jgi:hypothetical protein
MRADAHPQEQVARRAAAGARAALAREPDAPAVADAGRDLDLEVASVTERDAPPAAAGGLLQRELELGLLVGAAHGEAVEAAAAARAAAPGAAAEQALEDVVEAALAELDADILITAPVAEALEPAAGAWPRPRFSGSRRTS